MYTITRRAIGTASDKKETANFRARCLGGVCLTQDEYGMAITEYLHALGYQPDKIDSLALLLKVEGEAPQV